MMAGREGASAALSPANVGYAGVSLRLRRTPAFAEPVSCLGLTLVASATRFSASQETRHGAQWVPEPSIRSPWIGFDTSISVTFACASVVAPLGWLVWQRPREHSPSFVLGAARTGVLAAAERALLLSTLDAARMGLSAVTPCTPPWLNAPGV